jgi:Cu-Zn family superoxide dismutase
MTTVRFTPMCRNSVLAGALALLCAPTLASAQGHGGHMGGAGAMAVLKDGTGKEAGSVMLMPGKDGLMGTVDVAGLTPGEHGMHIHTVGKCDDPAFTSAGGHLNPDGKQHGFENPMGSHQGDLPELTVGADGKAKQSFAAKTTIAAVLDADGAAFVIHAAADDMKSDPAGNSGARILCGVFGPMKH